MGRLVEIWTEELPKDWWWTPDRYLGGTPEFAINTAKALKDNVIVYYDGKAVEYEGIFYLPRTQFVGKDIVIACNSKPPRLGNYNIAWLSWADKTHKDYADFDECITLSPYHQKMFGDSRVIAPGYWPEQFKRTQTKARQCLYSSSPDRGGYFLKGIWTEVAEKTGAKLISTYEVDISEKEMCELYSTSQFWLHPGFGIELYCISAMKAQVGGCIPVVVPNMALETTVKYGVKTTIEMYKEDLIQAILNPPAVEKVQFQTWPEVTKELLTNVVEND
jgi:hypothetical protein